MVEDEKLSAGSTSASIEQSKTKKKKEPEPYCCKGLIAMQNEFLESLDTTLEILPSKESTSWLRKKKKIIDSEMEQASKTHKTILTYGEVTDKVVIEYLSGRMYNHIRDSYCDLSSALEDKLGPENEHLKSSTDNKRNEQVDLSLPRMQLPTFSGKYEEWLPFHNLFIARVGKKTTLDPVEKLSYLMSHVTDEAYVTIKNLPLKAENYDKAMDLLNEQFNHPRKIAHTYMKKLLDGKPIATENVKDIRNFVSTVKDCSISLKDLNLPVDEWDYILLYVLQSKIPHTLYTKWEEELGSSRGIPKLETFMDFLEKRYRTLEMLEAPEKEQKKSNKVLHVKNTPNHQQNPKSLSRPKSQNQKYSSTNKIQRNQSKHCALCNGDHPISRCKKFLNNTPFQRRNLAEQYKLCINCLGSSHAIETCYSMKTCIYCQEQHHSLLHLHNTDHNLNSTSHLTIAAPNYPQFIPSSSAFYASTEKPGMRVLGTALVRLVNASGLATTARVLLDSGSEDNYITTSMVNSAGLKKYHAQSCITGLNDITVGSVSYKVNFKIQSLDGLFEDFTEASVVDTITSKMPSRYMDPENFGFLNNLPLADPHFNHPGQINLLLGVGFVVKIRQAGLKKFNELMAEQTLLGWVIMGRTAPFTNEVPGTSSAFFTKNVSNNELSSQIQKFFEVEECSTKVPEKPEDLLCEQKFLESIKRCEDGRLSVALPFREDDPVMGSSKNIAMKRFLTLERKLEQNPNLKQEYHKTIHDYLESGHLIPFKQSLKDESEYFLPHHAVLKDSSTTTKVRVVFDGSCRSADGSSLNDHLLTGPKLQTDIRDVFFSWRHYKFALTADIAKMYRMFWIDERDHKYQKILWRFNSNENVKEYALTTVTFGTSSAPYQAIRALNYIAEKEMSTFPLAAKAIPKEFYVDDFISGAHSMEEAIHKQSELRQMLNTYGLNIRKWSSNNVEALKGIDDHDRETSAELIFEDEEFRKTLGVYWAPKLDCFSFSTNNFDFPQTKFTKRNVLSLIARLYDPLGWVGPCTLHAKLIMQRIWEQNLLWDDEVCGDIKQEFQIFLSDLSCLSSIKIPRWTNITDDSSPVTLYGFSDASLKAYGAVVYLLNPNLSEENRLILLASRTKVKPLKHITLARLELCAAVMLADLLKWAKELLNPRPVKVWAFSDSKIVLSWLNSHPSRWKMYVASRTTKILETTNSKQWNYINTKSNPADFASRGLLPSEILNNSLWWNGPCLETLNCTDQELKELTEEDKNIISIETKEEKTVVYTTISANNFLFQLIEHYSSHGKMCRILSYVLKFIRNCIFRLQRKNTGTLDRYIPLMNVSLSPEMLICRLVQSMFYFAEIRALKSNQPVNKKSSLLSLNPFIDCYGILRVGGRLQNTQYLSYDQRHPIILPAKHQVVKNLILLAHHATLHGMNSTTQAYLRHKFYIIRAGDRIKYFIQRCPTCIRYARQVPQQLMGSLPQDRVNPHRAFLNSGVDYAGPFTLKAYSGRCKKFLKHYVALFVCFSTKAIHLELVSDLTATAFLASFKRFVSRRGQCKKLYSDRGTNFVKGDKMLTQEIHLAQLTWKTDLEVDFQAMGTVWHFNPPGAPHFGGLWEAGVKSMKAHLKKVIGKAFLTPEEFNTLLVQIEGILNSRPLLSMSNDPSNLAFLTPAHFLIGESIVTPPERAYDCSNAKHPIDRWQHLQKLRQSFWISWRKDFLHHLNTRSKWQTPGIQFKKGDLVLLTDENCPPNHWPKAIITDVHPGNDGEIRVITIQTEKGQVFTRPTVKVRFLPIGDPESEGEEEIQVAVTN